MTVTVTTADMVDLSLGRQPHGIINPEVLEQPGFLEKWERCRTGS